MCSILANLPGSVKRASSNPVGSRLELIVDGQMGDRQLAASAVSVGRIRLCPARRSPLCNALHVEFAMHRSRTTLTPICIIWITLTLLGCTSGTDAVPIPGADAVITAPVDSTELAPITDPAATDPSPVAETDAPIPTLDEPAPTAPVAETSASTTTAPPPETTAAPPATDAPPLEDVFLRVGDEGPEVGVMQLKLSVLEYLPAGSDTGVFDEATERGLRGFQSDYGLGVDGIFGPLTGRALNAAVQSVAVEN